MINSLSPDTHKYNVAVWTQSLEKQVKEQRLLCARLYVASDKDRNNKELDTKYRNAYVVLCNLYKSRQKLRHEAEQLNSQLQTNKAI